MPRVVSLYLPAWPTDRLRRSGSSAAPPDEPLATVAQDGARRVLAGVDAAALERLTLVTDFDPSFQTPDLDKRVPGREAGVRCFRGNLSDMVWYEDSMGKVL